MHVSQATDLPHQDLPARHLPVSAEALSVLPHLLAVRGGGD